MAKLLNSDLIDKDALISRLKYRNKNLKEKMQVLTTTINAFKEYDEKRKEYYRFLVEDWQNSEAKPLIEKLQEKVKSQKEIILNLEKKLHIIKVLPDYNKEELENIINHWSRVEKEEQLTTLQRKYDYLSKQYKTTVNELIDLKRKFNVF